MPSILNTLIISAVIIMILNAASNQFRDWFKSLIGISNIEKESVSLKNISESIRTLMTFILMLGILSTKTNFENINDGKLYFWMIEFGWLFIVFCVCFCLVLSVAQLSFIIFLFFIEIIILFGKHNWIKIAFEKNKSKFVSFLFEIGIYLYVFFILCGAIALFFLVADKVKNI